MTFFKNKNLLDKSISILNNMKRNKKILNQLKDDTMLSGKKKKKKSEIKKKKYRSN